MLIHSSLTPSFSYLPADPSTQIRALFFVTALIMFATAVSHKSKCSDSGYICRTSFLATALVSHPFILLSSRRSEHSDSRLVFRDCSHHVRDCSRIQVLRFVVYICCISFLSFPMDPSSRIRALLLATALISHALILLSSRGSEHSDSRPVFHDCTHYVRDALISRPLLISQSHLTPG
jgi:hypothetical protein